MYINTKEKIYRSLYLNINFLKNKYDFLIELIFILLKNREIQGQDLCHWCYPGW